MTKWIFVLMMLVLVASPTFADDVFAEIGDAGTVVAQNVELSLLGGTIGWGAGAYWPLYEVKPIGATVGPFIGFGSQMVAGGVGARLAVEIPMLENYIDFLAAGGAYKHDSLTFELWVGKTIPLKK